MLLHYFQQSLLLPLQGAPVAVHCQALLPQDRGLLDLGRASGEQSLSWTSYGGPQSRVWQPGEDIYTVLFQSPFT